MEISLSQELMALLEKFITTFAGMRFQYLFAIIPGVFIFLLIFLPNAKPLFNQIKRWWLIWRFEKASGDSVVSLVHTSFGGGLFKIFQISFINLGDSQKLLRALKELPLDRPIDLILHTPGGLVIAAEQIARALRERKGIVRAYIPQYAMSGGTLIALACDSIHMGDNAIMGPLDPQLSIGLFEIYPAASIVRALEYSNPNRDDKTLILADIAKKALIQMRETVIEIMANRMGKKKASCLANKLCNGNWTHDYGINRQRALELGLQVGDGIPVRLQEIFNTYPCESSVSYRKKKDKGDGDNAIRVHL